MSKVRSFFSGGMNGRYGADQLGTTLVVSALVLAILANWWGRWLGIVSLLLLVAVLLRAFSRDLAARRKENRAFLGVVARPLRWCKRQQVKFANRKTKAYVRCPHCGTEFALPKGRGRLRATCPTCGQKSEHTV